MKKILIVCIFSVLSIMSFGQVAPQKDTASYVLQGKIDDFQMLFLGLQSPGDITPNQKEHLLEWIKTLKKGEKAIETHEDKKKTKK